MPKTALIAGVTGQDGARVRAFAFLDRPWDAVFTPEARRAGGRRLFLNRWPSLPDQLRGMRQSMDPDTGAILSRDPSLQGIPDLVVEGDGYTMESMGRLLAEPIKQQFPVGLGHQPLAYWLSMAIVAQLLVMGVRQVRRMEKRFADVI